MTAKEELAKLKRDFNAPESTMHLDDFSARHDEIYRRVQSEPALLQDFEVSFKDAAEQGNIEAMRGIFRDNEYRDLAPEQKREAAMGVFRAIFQKGGARGALAELKAKWDAERKP